MRHGSLFSGIGGFDLAAEWMGWENIFHCEWNEFGQKILKHYWPNAKSYSDITKTDFSIHRGEIDILTGGFPCQPYSAAGKRKGKEDERHLWPHFVRAIKEIQPKWIVGENVVGLLNWNGGMVFDEVCADLEAAGYYNSLSSEGERKVLPAVLPAAGVDADHSRSRVWFIAHSDSIVLEGLSEQHRIFDKIGGKWRTPGEISSYPSIGRLFRQGNYRDICRGNGLPDELDTAAISFGSFRKESIKAFGNAVHPKVVHEIFKAISLVSREDEGE